MEKNGKAKKMKDTKKQREKDESNVKTKSPHSIATPSTTTSTPSTPASNVLKITKKSHTIQKRPTNKTNSVQTKLMSVKNENGTKSVIVSKINTNSAATPTAKVSVSTVAVASAQLGEINNACLGRPVKSVDSKRVATQVESKVSVEHTDKNFIIKMNKQKI